MNKPSRKVIIPQTPQLLAYRECDFYLNLLENVLNYRTLFVIQLDSNISEYENFVYLYYESDSRMNLTKAWQR